MRRIVTISYTGLDAPGGVPRWNRDLHSAFADAEIKPVHYCWQDFAWHAGDASIAEWDRARVLNGWLRSTGRITGKETVLVDGFWGLGLEWHPNVISVSHGNWSHTTHDDVLNGIPPEFPFHHQQQLDYRRRHLARGGKIVAVSDFIANQCKVQWGMDTDVINNGIDTEKFRPNPRVHGRGRRLIIHGTTTANKGFEHTEALKNSFPGDDVLLLDEAQKLFALEDKYDVLGLADLVVHPSAHEGNSYFVLETLACGVPILTYNVGLMWELWMYGFEGRIGKIVDRRYRSPQTTVTEAYNLLSSPERLKWMRETTRQMATAYSIEKFREQWRDYILRYDETPR